MNKVMLIGRLTKDVLLKTGNTSLARFTLAVNRRAKNEADYISCVAFGRTAEVLDKYTKKGHRIGICGRLETGSYTNREGQKVYTTDVIVEDFYFLESKQQEPKQEPKQKDDFFLVPDAVSDDDLPF